MVALRRMSVHLNPNPRFKKETHFSPFSTLPCSTCRWYSIDDKSALRSVLSVLAFARWVLVSRSARGWACAVASIVKGIMEYMQAELRGSKAEEDVEIRGWIG